MRRAGAGFRSALILGLGLACGPGVVWAEAIPEGNLPIALLQGLDKITARVSTFEAPVGETVAFGTLRIVVRQCNKRPPTEPPESAAFLEVVEQHDDRPAVPLYAGWMFASSPALSALEHSVYDVWVLDCLVASIDAAPELPADESGAQ